MRWPLDSVKITQGFHGINANFKYEHWGTDLAANEGVAIKAPESGVVTAVNSGWKEGGYLGGNYVKMTGDSGYSYYLGHMSSVGTTAGKRVNQGDVIGKVGSTGQATGPHVHFEMYKGGSAVDAEKIIKGGDMATITKAEATALKNVMRVLNSEGKGWDRNAVHSGKHDEKEINYLAGMGVNAVEAIARYSQQAWDEGKAYRANKDTWLAAFKEKPGLLKQIEDLKKQLADAKKQTVSAAPSDAEVKLQTIKDALGIK